MEDIVMEILLGLSQEDKKEITKLNKPMVGDGVYDVKRELRGEYPGGEIVEIDAEEDEYRVAWWDPEDKGYQKDTTVFETMDFIHYSDGKSGRLWHIA